MDTIIWQKTEIVSGINTNKVQTLILDLYNYLELIKTKFNDIEQKIDELKNSCQGAAINSFMNSFSDFEKNFSTITSNIQLYAADITRAKNNFQQFYGDTSPLSNAKTLKEE